MATFLSLVSAPYEETNLHGAAQSIGIQESPQRHGTPEIFEQQQQAYLYDITPDWDNAGLHYSELRLYSELPPPFRDETTRDSLAISTEVERTEFQTAFFPLQALLATESSLGSGQLSASSSQSECEDLNTELIANPLEAVQVRPKTFTTPRDKRRLFQEPLLPSTPLDDYTNNDDSSFRELFEAFVDPELYDAGFPQEIIEQPEIAPEVPVNYLEANEVLEYPLLNSAEGTASQSLEPPSQNNPSAPASQENPHPSDVIYNQVTYYAEAGK
ncbi:hypothetical protein FRC12_011523 [Ceratobasidium sp. 428]|nr:hypothetical protein FRC12_011523 [Ceratobasidium sp. 428]